MEWLSQRIGMEAMTADYARTDVGYEAANVVRISSDSVRPVPRYRGWGRSMGSRVLAA